jgi:hypothetical protein
MRYTAHIKGVLSTVDQGRFWLRQRLGGPRGLPPLVGFRADQAGSPGPPRVEEHHSPFFILLSAPLYFFKRAVIINDPLKTKEIFLVV